MELNNTTQYAIRILSYIANQQDDKLQHARDISTTLSIPYKFLTKIMTKLVKEEFILSIQGRDGGYKLQKPAKEITILDILNAFGEFQLYENCILGVGKCNSQKTCILHNKWVKPRGLIKKMFEETTLENIDEKGFKI